jgi:hypothetical protein
MIIKGVKFTLGFYSKGLSDGLVKTKENFFGGSSGGGGDLVGGDVF